jgi:hypothetical protein
MKKAFKILGIIALVAMVGLSMAACDDDSGSGGGRGNGLEGSGVVWVMNGSTTSVGSAAGLVFKDGKAHTAALIGGTWLVASYADYTYTSTHITNIDSGRTSPYTVSGNTFSYGLLTYSKRTGQKITWI